MPTSSTVPTSVREGRRAARAWAGALALCVAVVAGAPPAVAQPAPPGAALYAQSWAVVVGVNRFRHRGVSRLQYAVNDAQAVARALGPLGFSPERITVLLDERATRAEVERVLSSTLRRSTGSHDRLFVFFATHGVTSPLPGGGEEGYLLLHDSDPEDLPLTALAMHQLKQIVSAFPPSTSSWPSTPATAATAWCGRWRRRCSTAGTSSCWRRAGSCR